MAYLDFLKGTDLTCRLITKELEFGFGVGRGRTVLMRYDEFEKYPTSLGWLDFNDSRVALLYNEGQTGFTWNAGRLPTLMNAVNKIEHDIRLTDGE